MTFLVPVVIRAHVVRILTFDRATMPVELLSAVIRVVLISQTQRFLALFFNGISAIRANTRPSDTLFAFIIPTVFAFLTLQIATIFL
jgi:hypothetical protein